MRRVNIALSILILGLNTVYSQKSIRNEHKHSLILGFRSHYGFIIAHHKELRAVSQTNPWGFEAEIEWHLMTNDIWQYFYCYPRAGFTLFYTNFDNPEELGSSLTACAFIEPVISAERKINLSMRFGIGPNYLNTVYDSITNPENTFYSTHISFVVFLGFGLNYKPNERINLRLGAQFNHTSNGGIKNPNSGMNFPTMNLGIDYNLRPMPFTNRTKDKSLVLIPEKNRFDLTFLATAKTDLKGHAKYPVYGVAGSYSRVIGRLNALAGGLEFVADLADRNEIRRLEIMEAEDYIDHKYLACTVGHELLLGKFNFYQQLGIYLYSPFERKDKVYQRYGLHFYIYKKFFIGINIKAHRHVADFLDFRTGFSF